MRTIDELIAECTAYDYKVMLEEKRPKSWLKSVSAFANGLGGSLFYGIDNDSIVRFATVDESDVGDAVGEPEDRIESEGLKRWTKYRIKT